VFTKTKRILGTHPNAPDQKRFALVRATLCVEFRTSSVFDCVNLPELSIHEWHFLDEITPSHKYSKFKRDLRFDSNVSYI